MKKFTSLIAALALPVCAMAATDATISPSTAQPLEAFGVGESGEITVNFTGATTVDVLNFDVYTPETSPIVVKYDATGEVVSGAIYMPPVNGAPGDVWLTVTKEIYTQTYIDGVTMEGTEENFLTASPDGKYTLTIPAGTFKVDGTPNTELNFTYTLGKIQKSDIVITVNIDGTNVDDVTGAKLTFSPQPSTITVNPDNRTSISLVQAWGMEQAAAYFTPTIGENEVMLNLNEPYIVPGNYYIYVPEGFFLLDGVISRDARSATITINKKDIPKEMIIEPMAGTKIPDFTEAKVTWRGYGPIEINPLDADAETSKLYFQISDKKIRAYAEIDASNNDPFCTTYTFRPDKEIEDTGKLTLVIPADRITIDGKNPSTDVSYFWTIENSVAYKLVLTPAPGKVADLTNLTLSAEPEPASLTLGEGSAFSVDLYKLEGGTYAMLTNYAGEEKGDKAIALTAGDKVNGKGIYRVSVPQAYVLVNGKPNAAITFDYEIDGTESVDAIIGENATADVYDLNGTVVLKGADKEAVKALKGIYVINGKCVILK